MSKNLLIVESPAKSRTLARFLGKDFEILSTIGHVVDLPKSKLGVDPKKKFAPDYHVIKGKEKVIAELRKAAKKADKIYLAPDPDREGEAIAWHVANELKDSRKKCVRVTFNEITKSAVTEAIKHPREIDINLVNAQQARRVLDRLVGYIVSPFLWKTVARNLSAGRVQSVALRLVCEREEEIRKFVQQEYWQIAAKLETKKHEKFEAQLVKIDDQTVSKPDESGETVGKKIVIRSQVEADGYIADMRKQSYAVTSVKDSERVRKPSPPFITSTLQQEAAKAYGFSPKVTMGIAQALYEGIEVGKEGATGLITYMRTDSTRISKEALDHVRDHINKSYGESYLPDKPNFYGRAKEAQDAHEAIRPTHLDLPPDKVRKHLTPQQFKLYSLIWNRFVSSQMTNAIFDVRTVDITGGKFLLRVTAQHLKFDGFLRLYHEEKEPDENGNGEGIDAQLPVLKAKDPLTLADVIPTQSFTRPPARYSEASLIKRMEADGIGRPSTYASIVSTIKDRKYVELQERKLFPTDLGEAVNKMLVTYFPDIFNIEFTANMEKELDLVEEGTDDWVTVVSDFYGPFMKTIGSLEKSHAKIKKSMTETTDIKCEKCGSPMIIKWGRNGRFLACSSYPECKSTRPLPGEEAQTKTDEKCEKCGAEMVIKTGRFGRFMACSRYPDCKTTKPLTLGIACPKPGCGGQIMEKTTKGRKLFYGCSNYPKCDFASWDKPVKHPCPVCNHPFMVQKTSKVKGDYTKCPECGHTMAEESHETKTVA